MAFMKAKNELEASIIYTAASGNCHLCMYQGHEQNFLSLEGKQWEIFIVQILLYKYALEEFVKLLFIDYIKEKNFTSFDKYLSNVL